MELVILNSDIARLVLEYLKRQGLDKAARVFSRTSQYLRDDLLANVNGVQAYSFFPDLEDILGEHVRISQKVTEYMTNLPHTHRRKLQKKSLPDKVIELIKHNAPAVQEQSSESNGRSNLSATFTRVEADKENRAKQQLAKRKRESTDSLEDDFGASSSKTKRRRNEKTFCYVDPKVPKMRIKRRTANRYTCNDNRETDAIDSTTVGMDSDDDDDEISDESESESSNGTSDEEDEMSRMLESSTPHRKAVKKILPPELFNAILDNSEFHTKVAENINQALSTSGNALNAAPPNPTITPTSAEIPSTSSANAERVLKEDFIITANDNVPSSNSINFELDEMIKKIIANTEKEPFFDVIAGAAPSRSAGVQCNILNNESANTVNVMGNTNNNNNTNISTMLNSTTTAENTSNPIPPQTPLIIRTASAGVPPTCGGMDANGLMANTSFGSLIDPNFSISKLIVLNSNESAQKNPPEQSIGDTTADNIIQHIVDDQVYFDALTGQLTLPLQLTNGIVNLENIPFLNNNELITQQLQINNIANMDTSRMEISLPTPIVVHPNEFPPNSVILNSAQKLNAPTQDVQQQSQQQQNYTAPTNVGNQFKMAPAETAQRTASKLSKNGSDVSLVPTSLDTRMHVERMTPSTTGILNVKAYRSLSTPRKRVSHVRTLNFSPRSIHNGPSTSAALLVNGTPVSSRSIIGGSSRLLQPAIVEEPQSDKPIIRNVEIWPRLSNNNAMNIDTSANESSNSNIPPMFIREESSNLTVIEKANADDTSKTKRLPDMSAAETPKRKQPRRAAKSCKRQLSKSPVEEDELDVVDAEVNDQQGEVTPTDVGTDQTDRATEYDEKNVKSDEQDDMMAAWQRMRNTTTSDLDNRLRLMNAQAFPSASRSRRRQRRKKPNTPMTKKQRKAAAEAAAEAAAAEQAECFEQLQRTILEEDHERSYSDVEATPAADGQNQQNNGDNEKPKATEEKTKSEKNEIPVVENSKNDSIQEAVLAKPQQEQDVSASKDKTIVQNIQNVEVRPPNPSANSSLSLSFAESVVVEPCAVNMARLLETPFKDHSLSSTFVPPTPGVCFPSLNTPHTKKMIDEFMLFGSLTKSELDTPYQSAITPGLRFTPFSNKDATPRSLATTEYSSGGGSYYKPDESDDLDRNFDRKNRDPGQKARANEEDNSSRTSLVRTAKEPATNTRQESVETTTLTTKSPHTESIPVQTLKVEPIILKRVKSFGTEATDSTDIGLTAEPLPAIAPHYTMAEGLPDISVTEDETTSSSSSSSTTTSSSSGSDSKTPSTKLPPPPSTKETSPSSSSSSSSNTDSSNDSDAEEWSRAKSKSSDEGQLVRNDGEVRYPVRSWITPNKQPPPPPHPPTEPTVQTLTFPVGKSASVEAQEQQRRDLEEKRSRVVQKLQESNKNKAKAVTTRRKQPPQTKTTAAAAKAPQKAPAKRRGVPVTKEPSPEKPTLEVLTALRLSAKKQPPPRSEKSPIIPSLTDCRVALKRIPELGEIDDNAVSNVFEKDTNLSAALAKGNSNAVPAGPRQKPRSVLKIDALPARSRGKRKQVEATKLQDTNEIMAPSHISTTPTPANEDDTRLNDVPESPICKFKIQAGSNSTFVKRPPKKAETTKPVIKRISSRVTSSKASSTRKTTKVDNKSKDSNYKEKLIEGNKPKGSAKTNKKNIEKPKESSEKSTNNKEATKEPPKHQTNSSTPTPPSAPQHQEQQQLLALKQPEHPPIPVQKQQPPLPSQPHPPLPPLPSEPAVPPPPTPPPPAVEIAETNKQSTAADGDNVSDADSEEPWSTVMYREADIISLVYQGPESSSTTTNPQTRQNFDHFRMDVAIDDQMHTWRISQDYNLFSCKPAAPKNPAPIRTVPKKRKVCIQTVNHAPTVDTTQMVSPSGTIEQTQPSATSTPLLTTRTQSATENQNTVEESPHSTTPDLPTTSTTTTTSLNVVAAVTPNQAEKLKLEDIELLLSHLHGN